VTAAAGIAPMWFTSRAAGITALLLCTVSLTLGLAMATRVMPRAFSRVNTRLLHEALSIGALVMIAFHGFGLLLDPYLRPGLVGVVVPFAARYRPVATAAGQIAAYGIAALALSYYARDRLGTRRWRSAHRWITGFWALALVHGLVIGTDRSAWWFLAALGLPMVPAVFYLLARLDPQPRSRSVPSSSGTGSPVLRRS
jgi:sulfoxide reductase heme-binding subunit YedZ